LLPQVDDWLAAREADGWLNQLRRQWFGTQTARTPQEAGVRAVVAAVELRLQLMPFVAAVKRREHLPIADPTQEARVLEHVRGAASAAGLDAESVAEFFRVQMEAAKLVEERDSTEPIAIDNVSLPDLRAAVARVSGQLIAELGRCRSWLADTHLDAQLREGLAEMRLPARMLDELTAALRRVRAAR
jgi:chorismate mutase-like protein